MNQIAQTLSFPPVELLGKYPIANDNNLSVHFMPDKALLFWQSDENNTFNGEGSGFLELEYAQLLSYINGYTTTNDIILAYCQDHQKNFLQEWVPALRFFKVLCDKKRLRMSEDPVPSTYAVRSTGSTEYYLPANLVVELTNKCNLNCEHCYCFAGPKQQDFVNTDKLLNLLDYLHLNGLHGIELTGGEPTLHPDFKEIVEFCVERFSPVGILTNGTNITDELADLLGAHQERLLVNVSLDSSKTHLHDAIRGKKGSWEKTVAGIKRLTSRGILVRATMCVHESTVNDIEATLQLSQQLGARWFTHNTVSPWGRGKNVKWEMSRVKRDSLINEFKKIQQEKYAEMTTFIPDPVMDQIVDQGCGAGFNSMILGPKGDIRPCVILDESYVTFGNLFDQTPEEVFKSTIAENWRTLKMPLEEICGDCKYQKYCQCCIAKGIMLNDSFEDGCRWANHYGLNDWM